MRLGAIIYAARKRKGWSLADLQARTGLGRSRLNYIEKGHVKSPAFHAVVKIGRALDIPIARLARCKVEGKR